MGEERSPQVLHGLRLESALFVLVVEARVEPGVETHLREEARIGVRVAERVDVPADARADTEFLKEEVVAEAHVVDHIFVVGAGLVVHGPAPVSELKLAGVNHAPNEGT